MLYNLAQQGMRDLVLLERDTIASGGSGRSQAISRMHYSNPVTTSLAWESLKLFRSFDEAVGGPSGFVRTGYMLVVGPADTEAMEQNVAMQRSLGVNTSAISHQEAAEVAPMLALDDAAGLAYEPESGYADPYAVASTYARRARDMGAEVNLETPVARILVSDSGVQGVETSQGTVSAPIVVVAAGPWSTALLQDIGIQLPVQPVRHQLIVLQRPADLLPDHPVVGDLIHETSFRPDSTSLTLIGSEEEEVDLDTWNRGVDMDVVASAFSRVAARCPLLAQARFRSGWSGLFDVTPDWHPILDQVDGVEGLYCAVGFSGHGFKLSPMIGVVMAELITQGRASSVDISMLDWARFKEDRLINSRYRYRVLA
jgi:sarcosine oxidase subunit beta